MRIVLALALACAVVGCSKKSPVFPNCGDNVVNGDETDVDCGGGCDACPAPSSCFDGVRNGLETDIDCGPGCARCQLGAHCGDWVDCASNRCATSIATGEQICAPNDGT
jgi:hypothetical protein